MEVEVAVLGSPSLISLTVSVGVRQHFNNNNNDSMAEFRSCVKVEVAVLGSPSLISLTVSVDVKQHFNCVGFRAQELCESRGGRPGLLSLISLRFL